MHGRRLEHRMVSKRAVAAGVLAQPQWDEDLAAIRDCGAVARGIVSARSCQLRAARLCAALAGRRTGVPADGGRRMLATLGEKARKVHIHVLSHNRALNYEPILG